MLEVAFTSLVASKVKPAVAHGYAVVVRWLLMRAERQPRTEVRPERLQADDSALEPFTDEGSAEPTMPTIGV